MGDSTLSGEGAGQYRAGTDGQGGNWCHRSANAEIHQLELPPDVARFNLACSGAKAKLVGLDGGADHPDGSQARQLARIARDHRITHIVVAVGANDDPDFINTLGACVQAWVGRTGGGCSEQLRQQWPRRVERMQPKVASALGDIREVMRRADYRQDEYSLIVQSYASPVGPGIRPDLQDLSGCPLLSRDVRWIRRSAVPRLSDGLREVALEQGARFLDLSRAGFGHEACTGLRGPEGSEWFRRLAVDWQSLEHENRARHALQESFHPNAKGYSRIAGCMSEFMNTSARTSVCSPGPGGGLRPVPPEVAASQGQR